MKYYIGECSSSGRQFDNWDEFVKALKDLANTYETEGEEWFEVDVVRD